MKLNTRNTVTMEYRNNTWNFIDPNGHRIAFEQALVDAKFQQANRVTGYVLSVHGVDQEIAQLLDSRTRDTLGMKGIHSLGRGSTLRRLRLMPGGVVELVSQQ